MEFNCRTPLQLPKFSRMKKVIFALIACAFVSPLSHAQTAVAAEKKETELETAMDKMSGAFKKLRRQVKEPANNASSIALLADLRAGAKESIKLVPALAADQPADKRVAFIEGYKKKINELIAQMEPLEVALKANKNEEAAAIVAKLGSLQKEGHKEYKKPE